MLNGFQKEFYSRFFEAQKFQYAYRLIKEA